MVNNRAIKVIGLIFGMKTRSYQALPFAFTRIRRVNIPARKGIPK